MTKLLCKLLLNKYKQSGGKKPTGEIRIIQNGTYDVTNYASADVNVSGGSVTENDVNFYDYDGTLVDSYTKNQFLALTEMPANPSHTGLVAQGWNWSLADAKDYVTDYGILDVGQMYATNDNNTRIYIHLEDENLKPYLGFAINGSVIVDWGDGNTQTITGTNEYVITYTQHIYSSAGDYVIKINDNDTIKIWGNFESGCTIITNNSTPAGTNRKYQNSILKLELSSKVNIQPYAFANCLSLKSITMPYNIQFSSNSSYAFQSCFSLKSITLPNSITNISSNMFQSCNSLENINMPKNVVEISSYSFNLCYMLKRIILSNNITNIGTYAFNNCPVLETINIPNGITTISQYSFGTCMKLKNIVLPNSITSIGNMTFSSCTLLKNINIPNQLTAIPNQIFLNCYLLISLKFPNTITSIGSQAFNNCYGMSYYDFTALTSIPTLSATNAFTNIPSDCKIVVPDSLYEDWIVATNWSTYADYIVKESEYNAS